MNQLKLLATGCATAAIALAAPAGSALAADVNTLNIAGPAGGTVGQPMVFQISGNNPFNPDYSASFWYRAAVLSKSVVPACPADAGDGIQLAINTGAAVPVFLEQETIDWDGNFSQTFAYTPGAPGTQLLCVYTTDLTGYTLATASMTLDVRGASTTPAQPPAAGAKPANTKAPRITRSGGRLVCSPGSWSNSTGDYAYGWSVNGKRKRGAAGRKLRVTRALRGRKVACRVTASNATGAATAVSRPVRV
jgi:hypothetical protein